MTAPTEPPRPPERPEPRDELSKGERTRKKLVETTAALLRCQGYHATGLAQIVAESGAPRGSLYFYFPGGKDDLAIAAIAASSDAWRARIVEVLAAAPDLSAALDALVAAVGDELEASGWVNGCPVATVALEATSEPVRAMIADHFARWLEVSVELLVRFGLARPLAQELGLVGLSALEGALLLARVQRSRAPLLAVGRALRAMVGPYTAAMA
ncbi:MAG TPA: TetR/AcrR family transcriptional regulator, partial [Kofleriaceae bacterium]|nr:TetR/AcrR family transcriptional regulator [Kofleriaceae bacterium]